MSTRHRLYPTWEQEERMTLYCAHARYVWNLALEQMNYRHHQQRTPNWVEQARQMTEARHEFGWLREVPVIVGRQALRDFKHACEGWWSGIHGRPRWRKQGRRDGFGMRDRHGLRVRKLNRRWSCINISGIGWVKFRQTRDLGSPKSYRVTRDSVGHWHVAFLGKPDPIEPPGNGETVGVDRGVTVSVMLSTGEALHAPGLTRGEELRVARLRRKAGRQRVRGRPASKRLLRTRTWLNRTGGRGVRRRKDFVEKVSTDLARRFDLIRIENLRVDVMTRTAKGTAERPGSNVRRKTGLNRAILENGWGALAQRLQDKAPYRVEKINPAFTSQRCSRCGHVDPKSRESQARFRCTACGNAINADLNAAINIAAGRAVTARGASQLEAVNREPQRTDVSVA